MKRNIPAKTFLLGEYVALSGGPSIVLTTTPCFVFESQMQASFAKQADFHPDSPAGRLLSQQAQSMSYKWTDPYKGMGGLGASSAQFLGVYLSLLEQSQASLNQEALLRAYWQASGHDEKNTLNLIGQRPSGYDVLAQASSGCVYLNHEAKAYRAYSWPFQEIGFILIHTGQKLATHHHLQELSIPLEHICKALNPIVERAKAAFDAKDSASLTRAVQDYASSLAAFNLVAPHTLCMLEQITALESVLAAKGCGALGADVIFVLVIKSELHIVAEKVKTIGRSVLATSEFIYLPKKSTDLLFSP